MSFLLKMIFMFRAVVLVYPVAGWPASVYGASRSILYQAFRHLILSLMYNLVLFAIAFCFYLLNFIIDISDLVDQISNFHYFVKWHFVIFELIDVLKKFPVTLVLRVDFLLIYFNFVNTRHGNLVHPTRKIIFWVSIICTW